MEVFHVQLDPSAGHLGNYLSKFNAAHSVTCCFSSIRNVSLMGSRIGFEALQGLIIESEPHSGKWKSWYSKLGLSKPKGHTLLWRLRFIYSPTDVQLFQHHLLKSVLPRTNCFCAFVKTKLGICVWVYIQVLHVSLITCLFTHQHHSLDYCSFMTNLQVNRLILFYFSFSKLFLLS